VNVQNQYENIFKVNRYSKVFNYKNLLTPRWRFAN